MDTARNLVLWGTQATVDVTFRVPNGIEDDCKVFWGKQWFDEDVRRELLGVSALGLKQDHNIPLKDDSQSSTSSRDLEDAMQWLRTRFPNVEIRQIGGNSGIAALRGHYLGVAD